MTFQDLPPLSEAAIAEIFAECMRRDSALRDPVTISKTAYRDAVAAIDTWLTNYSYLANDALPEPAKTELTMQQKARIFFAVVNVKMNLGTQPPVEPTP